MLIYSTKFKVKNTFTKNQFVNSIIKWCSNKDYPMKNLESHISECEFSEIEDNQMLDVINIESLEIIAARHISETSTGNWTVDAILNYNKNMLTVYMDYTVNESTNVSKIHRSVPWIIKQIINDGFAENNLGFELQTNAIILNETNKELLLSCLESNNIYALPLVYLSSKSKLNADSIALKLAGLAVVITDPSDILYSLSPELYNSPIYLFVPYKKMEAIPFGDYPFHRDIINIVANYLNSRNYDKLETWEGLNGEALRLKSQDIINGLKKQNAEDNEFINEYLNELEEKNKEYEKNYSQIAEELQKLKYENQRLAYKSAPYSNSDTPLIISGKENDFYLHEQTEIIIDILKDYLNKNTTDSSRRADILKSIIEANPVKGIPDKYKKIIKDAFDGYTKFNCPKIYNALKETGIEVVEHTGHYKMQYHRDPRYSFEAAATPSDNRAGKNASAIISKLMF